MTYFAKLWIMPIVCGWSNGNARGEAEAHPPVITRPTKYPPAVFRDTGYSSNLDHPYSTTLSPKQPACGEKNLQKLNLIGNKSRPRVVWGARPMTLAGFLRSIADQRPRCHTHESCPGWKPRGQACFVWVGRGEVGIAKAAKYDFFSCNFVSLSSAGDRPADNSEDLVLMMLCSCVVIICRSNWLFWIMLWPVWINRKKLQFPLESWSQIVWWLGELSNKTSQITRLPLCWES